MPQPKSPANTSRNPQTPAHVGRPARLTQVKQHRLPGPCVTVVGAGVAGLTAAHELIERGFTVQVVERLQRPEAPGEVAVGGMARSQYGRVPVVTHAPDARHPTVIMQPTSPPFALGTALHFDPDSAVPPPVLQQVVAQVVQALAELAVEVEAGQIPRFLDGLQVQGHADADEAHRYTLAQDRAEAVATALRIAVSNEKSTHLKTLTVTAVGLGDTRPLASSLTAEGRRANARVEFAPLDHLMAGEHGYRFFPSFYRHLFDTMKRTPLLDDRDQETGRTAFDNLVATSTQALSLNDKRKESADFLRRKFKSTEELRAQLEELRDRLGIQYADVAQYYMKLLRYMTTSSERRTAEYEDISWWTYLQQGQHGTTLKYSERFEAAAKAAPQALVAMKAEVADARTQGTITVQLTLDQDTDGAHTDCTLNGPTSEAWLLPWRRYLVRQGVDFYRGELLDLTPQKPGVKAHWLATPVHAEGDHDPLRPPYNDDPAYYVLALHPQDLQNVLKSLGKIAPADSDIGKVAGLDLEAPLHLPVKLKDGTKSGGATYDQLLQHFAGIQYYFANDVKFVNGHVYFPDTEWGLSAISQLQFWTHHRNVDDGFLGQLSVDVGNCLAKSTRLDKCLLECTPQEIAEECWFQMKRSLQGPGRAHDGAPNSWLALPEPLYYHLDDGLEFQGKGKNRKLKRNLTPFLINIKGTWNARPGDPEGYGVEFGQVVLAGNAMKTWTRMSTMEASNESARHAVNAILRHLRATGPVPDAHGKQRDYALIAGDFCSVWNPEDLEMPDMMPMRRLDAKLLKEGLPHLFDLLNLDAIPQFYQNAPGKEQLDQVEAAVKSAIFKVFPELEAQSARVKSAAEGLKSDALKWSEKYRRDGVNDAQRLGSSLEDLTLIVLKTLGGIIAGK